MKRHVFVGLALMLCCFLAGGVYIVSSIQSVTQKLEQVIAFHQVEFLRKNLILHIRSVQSDLLLQGSPHYKGTESSIALIEAMEESADSCLSCHHSEETSDRLKTLEEATEEYMRLLSRTLTIRANNKHLENARLLAFDKGERLQKTVYSLSTASAEKISVRINKINSDITKTKHFLIVCLFLGPLAISIITVIFLRRYTGSINTLTHAAKTLEGGNLDYRIEDTLKDEFRTLANSFNGMASALKTEQKNSEAAQTLYQTLFESAGDAILITGLENENFGVIVSANNAASELYGYFNNELIGMDIGKLVADYEKERFSNRLNAVISEGWSLLTTRAIKKDGTLIHVTLSVGILEIGEVKHLLSFSRDVTAQLEAEKKQQHVNQMALVGQMAAGLAHEIKNPLAGVKVSLDVLADDLELNQEDRELFARIICEVKRMEKLLKNLLNYARPPQPQCDLIDINHLLDNSLKNVKVATHSKEDKCVYFVMDLAPDLPKMEVDSSQIQQVLLNIYLNAVDAIEEEGTITTITRMEPPETISIEIRDTGKGMSEQSLQNVFSPFFTTKTAGTGLGLSISKRLIEQHSGQIEVHSREGRGTSFFITLPLTFKYREQVDG